MPREKKSSTLKIWVKADNQNKPESGPQGYTKVSEDALVNKIQITKSKFYSSKSRSKLVWVIADAQNKPEFGPQGYTKVSEQDPVNKVQIKKRKFNADKNEAKLIWVKADNSGNSLLGSEGYTKVSEQDPGYKTQITKKKFYSAKDLSKFVWVMTDSHGTKLRDQHGYIKVSEQDPVYKVQVTIHAFRDCKYDVKFTLEALRRVASNLNYYSTTDDVTPLQLDSYNELSLEAIPNWSHSLAALNYYTTINNSASQAAPFQPEPILYIDDYAPLPNQVIDNHVTNTTTTQTNAWFNMFTFPTTEHTEPSDHLRSYSPTHRFNIN